MKTKTKVAPLIATIITIGSLSGGANATTLATQQASSLDNGSHHSAAAVAVIGINPFRGRVRYSRAISIFRISDILTQENLTLSQLGVNSFNLSFVTQNNTGSSNNPLGNGSGSYKVDYLGVFANGNFPTGSNLVGSGGEDWVTASNAYSISEEVDTGIVMIKPSQTISAEGFTLSGIVDDGDLTNDYVAFGVRYTEDPSFYVGSTDLGKQLNGFSLSVVPEPSTFLLLSIGTLSLITRRNK